VKPFISTQQIGNTFTCLSMAMVVFQIDFTPAGRLDEMTEKHLRNPEK
jgi:hypothetical protein